MTGPDNKIRLSAVPLRDDARGVSLETQPRKIQFNEHNKGYSCSLKSDWLQQLNLDEQSALTLHSFSIGAKPVIVQNPAVIIQPMDVLPDLDS